jgi:hypothetical protein
MNRRATNDEHTLQKMGYKQELRRKLTFFHNFAVTFSYLSPITGTLQVHYRYTTGLWQRHLLDLGQLVLQCFCITAMRTTQERRACMYCSSVSASSSCAPMTHTVYHPILHLLQV